MSLRIPLHFERATRFPGRNAWRWHLQLEAERIVSPARACAFVLFLGGWFLRARYEGFALPPLFRWVIVVILLYIVADFLVLNRWPQVAARVPYGSAVLDFLCACAIMTTSGPLHAALAPFLFPAAVSAALRLPFGPGAVLSVLYAAVYAVFAPSPGLFGPLCLLLVALGAALWAAQIHNDRVEHLRDPLTGIFTRPYALFHMEQLLQENATPFCVGLIDIDNFKQVNDTQGHEAGDIVLQRYVRLITSSLRAEDLVARWGGDELLVIWPGLGQAEALPIAERLRALAEEHALKLRDSDEEVHITVSIGLIEAGPGMRPAQLLQKVDTRLYAAKRMRNLVSTW